MQWLMKGFKLFLTITFMLSCAFAFTQESDKQKKLNELLDQAYETVDSSRDSALTILNNAEEIALDIKDTGALIFIYNNVGRIYIDKSQYENASVAYRDALKYSEAYGHKLGVGYAFTGLGNLHQEMNNLALARSYFQQGLAAYKEVNDSFGIGASLNNIGIVLLQEFKYDDAIDTLKLSLEWKESFGDEWGVASTMDNLAIIYQDLGRTEEAMDYFRKSIVIHEKLGDWHGASVVYNNLGEYYAENNNHEQAIVNYTKSMEYAQKLERKIDFKTGNYNLALSYAALDEYEKAYKHAIALYEIQNDLAKEQKSKVIAETEAKYQKEKDLHKIELLTKDKALQDAELERKNERIERDRQRSTMFAIGIGLVSILAIVILISYFIKRKDNRLITQQKAVVEEQKHLVEEKNKEITDSINYAKRIQSAILPPDKMVKEAFPNSFILYKPKDIVAGDFYWLEMLPTSSNSSKGGEPGNTILLAAADCTGHGVPGAMVSVVCNNALNRSVREHGLIDPAAILDKTREIVIAEFEKSEEEVKDGMDIALCSLTFANVLNEKQSENGKLKEKQSVNVTNKSTESEAQAHSASASASAGATGDTQKATGDTQTVSEYSALLKYSGAHNPLWIIRKDANEVEEIKGHKQPIGKYGEATPYITHAVQLNEGDSFYIFSDGYVDQFGGDKGKKLKAKNFKTLLLSMQNEPMARQKLLIDEAFESWKGSFEQLDDVCVIGVRI